jgi:acetyltransferase-like isoleucine patch superfamily enzyme
MAFRKMKEYFHSVAHAITQVLSYAVSFRLLNLAIRFRNRLMWYALKRKFRRVGENSFIEYPAVTLGEQYITIGSNLVCYARLRLEAYARHLGNEYQPTIIIGDNVALNYDCHIACINRVEIGNNVLIGSKVHITDHFHGEINYSALSVPPAHRKLVSKGSVIIKNNVWIGEGAVIMPNVTIGENAIIGANAVVTHDIPPNCIAVGVPARIIRYLLEK